MFAFHLSLLPYISCKRHLYYDLILRYDAIARSLQNNLKSTNSERPRIQNAAKKCPKQAVASATFSNIENPKVYVSQ